MVTFAGLGINLALGVLYSWSVISDAIEKAGWGWEQFDLNLPYSVACLAFCLIMVPAGRMQDKMSPRLVATIGGLLVGAGMILASFFTSVSMYVIGFGILTGAGIGFGYASATPPAVKWFSKAKTGLIAGLVVSGFGLASVYAAPLAGYLAKNFSLKTMMMSFGIGFLILVGILAQFLIPPPKGFRADKAPEPGSAAAAVKEDFSPGEMLKTWQYYLLWFMYACGAGAGLMIISVAKKINSAAEVGIVAVVALAIGNGGGRILAGMLSDKMGRKMTMFMFFVLQAAAIGILAFVTGSDAPNAVLLIIISAVVGANYGSNLALFPSITKDYFGLKNFGMNYGLVFTAWGIGGFILAQFAGKVYDRTQSFTFAFDTSIVLLIVAGIMVFVVRPPHHTAEAAEPVPEPAAGE